MQLWEDVDRQKFFMFDQESGSRSACDKFGLFPKTFTPYKSGFKKSVTARMMSPDFNYRVQPKKFDGYFQCPRPSGLAPSKTRIRLTDDIKTLPKPTNFLQFSTIYQTPVSPSLPRSPSSSSHQSSRQSNPPASRTLTLSLLKQNLKPKQTLDIKTKQDLDTIIEKTSKTNLSFTQRPSKPARRKLKGYFTTFIPSSTDLFQKEKRIRTITNPVQHSKQVKFEELDRKYLEKRRFQKILRDKLEILTN